MRLWHYKLIPFLPNSQLVAQWRELNSIFKKQDKHILINYVYEYPKENLLTYSAIVLAEIKKRGFKIKSYENYRNYFIDADAKSSCDGFINLDNPFPNHHTNRYLQQCFYNLQEKYDRGQKDFSEEEYKRLEEFVIKELFHTHWVTLTLTEDKGEVIPLDLEEKDEEEDY